MTSKEQIITINSCSLCNGSHNHILEIKGSKREFMQTEYPDESYFDKQFTVLLTCPKKIKTFNTTIILNTFIFQIESVSEKK